jgi:Methyltransferase domain
MISQDEWFKTVCDSYERPPAFLDGKKLPAFPSDAVQTRTTGQSGINTLREAFIFYQDCVENFSALGAPIASNHSLLDFGVGWGRIARFFMRELPLQNIHGLDVMQEFVDICKETFESDNFRLTAPFPPTKITDAKYTHIVGYSVFSHLSEQACLSWMKEFYRLLAPGGVVALTTRGRPFFDFCESLKNQGHTGYLAGLSTMFSDFNAEKSRYDAGVFVHSNKDGVVGGGAMTPDFYGESFIPQAYAEKAYSEWFTLEKFVYDPARQSHPIMFFRKK